MKATRIVAEIEKKHIDTLAEFIPQWQSGLLSHINH
jgi:hypothetical protein